MSQTIHPFAQDASEFAEVVSHLKYLPADISINLRKNIAGACEMTIYFEGHPEYRNHLTPAQWSLLHLTSCEHMLIQMMDSIRDARSALKNGQITSAEEALETLESMTRTLI